MTWQIWQGLKKVLNTKDEHKQNSEFRIKRKCFTKQKASVIVWSRGNSSSNSGSIVPQQLRLTNLEGIKNKLARKESIRQKGWWLNLDAWSETHKIQAFYAKRPIQTTSLTSGLDLPFKLQVEKDTAKQS